MKHSNEQIVRIENEPELSPDMQMLKEMGLKLVIKHSSNHYTYRIKMRKFLETQMIRWSYNRPVNMERSREIANSLIHKAQPLSFMLQCIYNTTESKLEIIDGMHRYYAIHNIHDRLGGSLLHEWFYNSVLLIEIKLNYTIGEVIDWFQSINNCSPVLDLYLNSNDEKKEIVEDVVNIYYAKYTIHFKGLNPNISNTSKELFTEIVSYIYDTFNVSIETKRQIQKILEDINKKIRETVTINHYKRLNPKITATAMEKCAKTQLYLFLATKETLFEYIKEYKL